jgi:hypothetical protein
MKSHRFINWLTGILLLVIAALSFASSYLALADLAQQHHFVLTYVFPLIIEGGMVVFSLAALRASLHAERARWAWTLVIGSSALALAFNVIHAHQWGALAMIMAAMPSLFLLLSFETFMSQIKAGVRRAAAAASIATLEAHRRQLAAQVEQDQAELEQAVTAHQAEKARLDAKLLELKEELAGLRKEKRGFAEVSEDTKTQALRILSERPDIGGSELGQLLGRSDSLGRKLKRELSLNGNGGVHS